MKDSHRLEWELTDDGHLRHVQSALFANIEDNVLILRDHSDNKSRLALTEEGHLKWGVLFVAALFKRGAKLKCTFDGKEF